MLLIQSLWKTGNFLILPDLLMSCLEMPLTSKCPVWSSISQEASVPAGHMAELVLPWLHTTSHPRTCIPHQMLCHTSSVARPLVFLAERAAAALTSQEGIPHQTLQGKTPSTTTTRACLTPKCGGQNAWVHPLGCRPRTRSSQLGWPTPLLRSSTSLDEPARSCRPSTAHSLPAQRVA